jgi:hypothetical protein
MASSEVRGLRLLHVIVSGMGDRTRDRAVLSAGESGVSLSADGVVPSDDVSADIIWSVDDDGEGFEAPDSDIFASAFSVLTRGGTIPAALMIDGGRRVLLRAVGCDVEPLTLDGSDDLAPFVVEGLGSGRFKEEPALFEGDKALSSLAFVVAKSSRVGDCLGDCGSKYPEADPDCDLSPRAVETLGGGVTDGELTTLEESLCLDGTGLAILGAVRASPVCSDESERSYVTVAGE